MKGTTPDVVRLLEEDPDLGGPAQQQPSRGCRARAGRARASARRRRVGRLAPRGRGLRPRRPAAARRRRRPRGDRGRPRQRRAARPRRPAAPLADAQPQQPAARRRAVVGALAGLVRGPRPPLRRRARTLARGHRGAVRPPRRALAALRDDAGDLAAHARRPAAEGAALAPRRALGPRLRRRRRRSAGAHPPHPRPARRRPPADRLHRARRARRAGRAHAPRRRVLGAARLAPRRLRARPPPRAGRTPGRPDAADAPLQPGGRHSLVDDDYARVTGS